MVKIAYGGRLRYAILLFQTASLFVGELADIVNEYDSAAAILFGD